MIEAIRNFLYGSIPASFESRYSLDTSVERLRSSTSRTVFGAFASQKAVGKVSEDRVVLQRVIPFVGNSFKPFFIGKFQRTAGGIVLTGRFTMHWLAKAFMTIWLGFCLFWTVLATISAASSQEVLWWFPFSGLGMIVAGVAMVQLCKFLARNDAVWLSKVISAALSGASAV